jgi:uncharacterized protein YbbK (DUF523 family)
MSGCRIGKVMLKGGATLHRLPSSDKDEVQASMIRMATNIATNYRKDEMAGCVVIGWGKDGSQSCGYRFHMDGPFGPTMAPAIIADILRRRMIESGDWS